MNEDRFWRSALGGWIRSQVTGPNATIAESVWRSDANLGERVQFLELCDGLLFNAVLDEILGRLARFQVFVQRLAQFFKLHQVLPVVMPDLMLILDYPVPEQSGNEVLKVLGLLLGAAIHTSHQSEQVDRLRFLDRTLQNHIISQLSELTGHCELLSLLSRPAEPKVIERLLEDRYLLTFKMLAMAEDMESDETSSTSGYLTQKEKQSSRTPSPDEYRRLSEQIEDLKLRKKTYEKQMEFMSGECDNLQKKFDELECENNMLRSDFDSLDKENKVLKEKLQCIPSLEHERDRLLAMTVDNERLKVEIDNLRICKQKLEEEKADATRLRKQLHETQGRLSAHLSNDCRCTEVTGQRGRDKLTEQLDLARLQIEQIQRDREQLEDIVHKLELENIKLREQVERQNTDQSYRSLQNMSLGDELSECHLEETIKELRKENTDLLTQVEVKATETKSLTTELTEKEDKIREMIQNMSLVSQQLENEQAKYGELRKEADNMVCMEQELRAKLANAEDLAKKDQDEFKAAKDRLNNTIDNVSNRLGRIPVQVKKRLNENDIELAMFKKEHNRLQNELQKKNNILDHTQAEVVDLRDELTRLQKHHAHCDQVQNTLQREVEFVKEQWKLTTEQNRQLKLAATNASNLQLRLEKVERDLVQKCSESNDLKAEMRTLNEQNQLETQKVQQLRNDLMNYKTRLANLVSRLRAVCVTCALKNSEYNETDWNDDDDLIEHIDKILLQAYSAAWKEAEVLSQQRRAQLDEINEFSKDIQSLRRAGAELDSLEKEHDLASVLKQVAVVSERYKGAKAREDDLTEQLRVSRLGSEELRKELKTTMKVRSELNEAKEEIQSLKMERDKAKDNAKLFETQLNKITLDLRELQSVHESLQTNHNRLNQLYDTVTVDFERLSYERNELKRKLQANTAIVESKLRADFYNERAVLEDQVKRTERELKFERERLLLCEKDLARVNTELENAKRDLEKNLNIYKERSSTSEEMYEKQRNQILNLTNTVQQLRLAVEEKDTEMASVRKRLECLQNLKEYNAEENQLVHKKLNVSLEQGRDFKSTNDAFLALQQVSDEKLNAKYNQTLEEKVSELHQSEQKSFMNKAAKALRLKQPPRRQAKPTPERNSGSNTEDSSIYSADEAGLPPLPREKFRGSLQVTPPCSSSDRASGSSPDYDQLQANGNLPMKCASIFADVPPLPSSFNRLRNSRISSSVRYPPTYRPQQQQPTESVSFDDYKMSYAVRNTSNGISKATHGNEHHTKRSPFLMHSSPNKNTVRPPPPPYRGRVSNSPSCFQPLHTSTPKSAEKIPTRLTVPQEGEVRSMVRDQEERANKAQSFYDNQVESNNSSGMNDNNQTKFCKPNDLWVGYGCV